MDSENTVLIHTRPESERLSQRTWIMTLVAIILLVVGFVTPGFEITTNNPEEMHTAIRYQSLWYYVTCHDGQCKTAALNYKMEDGGAISAIIAYPILATMSVVSGITAAFISGIAKKCNLSMATKRWTSTSLYLARVLSGFLSLVTTFFYSVAAADLAQRTDTYHTGYFPFSVFLFGVGGTIMFMTSLLTHLYYLEYTSIYII